MENDKSEKSVLEIIPEANERSLKKVPFVELVDGRMQGVVSSGSDISRVYVSYIKSGSHDFYCSTNNNRRCGGLGAPCKHIKTMLSEAVAQYGAKRVIQFLKVPMDADDSCKASDIMVNIKGSIQQEPASTVFSRFLGHLQFLELENTNQPIPEMSWFIKPSKKK